MIEQFLQRALAGDASAQYQVGVCYATGKGVQKDDTEAMQWYREAAEQGHAAAQYNVGSCYENGTGVLKDEIQAFQWYRKAADQGHAVDISIRYPHRPS
jgi:TPR repeat protein